MCLYGVCQKTMNILLFGYRCVASVEERLLDFIPFYTHDESHWPVIGDFKIPESTHSYATFLCSIGKSINLRLQ